MVEVGSVSGVSAYGGEPPGGSPTYEKYKKQIEDIIKDVASSHISLEEALRQLNELGPKIGVDQQLSDAEKQKLGFALLGTIEMVKHGIEDIKNQVSQEIDKIMHSSDSDLDKYRKLNNQELHDMIDLLPRDMRDAMLKKLDSAVGEVKGRILAEIRKKAEDIRNDPNIDTSTKLRKLEDYYYEVRRADGIDVGFINAMGEAVLESSYKIQAEQLNKEVDRIIHSSDSDLDKYRKLTNRDLHDRIDLLPEDLRADILRKLNSTVGECKERILAEIRKKSEDIRNDPNIDPFAKLQLLHDYYVQVSSTKGIDEVLLVAMGQEVLTSSYKIHDDLVHDIPNMIGAIMSDKHLSKEDKIRMLNELEDKMKPVAWMQKYLEEYVDAIEQAKKNLG